MEVFQEFTNRALAQYNKDLQEPVSKHDVYFKAYLIGMLSVLVSEKSLKNTYAWTDNVGSKE